MFALKAAMVVIASFASVEPDPSAAIFAATWVSLLSFLLEFRYEPYVREKEGALLKLTEFSMLALLLCAMGLADKTDDGRFRAGVRGTAVARRANLENKRPFLAQQSALRERRPILATELASTEVIADFGRENFGWSLT